MSVVQVAWFKILQKQQVYCSNLFSLGGNRHTILVNSGFGKMNNCTCCLCTNLPEFWGIRQTHIRGIRKRGGQGKKTGNPQKQSAQGIRRDGNEEEQPLKNENWK